MWKWHGCPLGRMLAPAQGTAGSRCVGSSAHPVAVQAVPGRSIGLVTRCCELLQRASRGRLFKQREHSQTTRLIFVSPYPLGSPVTLRCWERMNG